MSATRGDTTKQLSVAHSHSSSQTTTVAHQNTASCRTLTQTRRCPPQTSNSRFLLVIEGRETPFFSCSHDRSFYLLHVHDHYQFAVQTLTWNVMITKCCNLIGLHSRVQTVQLLGLFYTRPFLYAKGRIPRGYPTVHLKSSENYYTGHF